MLLEMLKHTDKSSDAHAAAEDHCTVQSSVPDANGIHAGMPASTHDITQILKVTDLIC